MACTCVGHKHRNMPGNPNACLTMRSKYEFGFDAEAYLDEHPGAVIADLFCPCQQNPHHTATVWYDAQRECYVITCEGCDQDLFKSSIECSGVELGAFREIFEQHQREMSA